MSNFNLNGTWEHDKSTNVDIQFFLEEWEYRDTKYLNFQIYIEGGMVNLQPHKIPYILAEELYYSLKNNQHFDLKNDLSNEVIGKFINGKDDKISVFIKECFDDLINLKDLEKFQDYIIRIHDLNSVIDVSIDDSVQQFNEIMNFVSNYILSISLSSEQLTPKITMYSIENSKYIQISNIDRSKAIFKIEELDYERFYYFLLDFANKTGSPQLKHIPQPTNNTPNPQPKPKLTTLLQI